MATTDVHIVIACNADMVIPQPDETTPAPAFAIEGKSNGDVEFRVNGVEMFTLDNVEWSRFLRQLSLQVTK